MAYSMRSSEWGAGCVKSQRDDLLTGMSRSVSINIDSKWRSVSGSFRSNSTTLFAMAQVITCSAAISSCEKGLHKMLPLLVRSRAATFAAFRIHLRSYTCVQGLDYICILIKLIVFLVM